MEIIRGDQNCTQTHTHRHTHTHMEAHFISLVFLRKCRNKTNKKEKITKPKILKETIKFYLNLKFLKKEIKSNKT